MFSSAEKNSSFGESEGLMIAVPPPGDGTKVLEQSYQAILVDDNKRSSTTSNQDNKDDLILVIEDKKKKCLPFGVAIVSLLACAVVVIYNMTGEAGIKIATGADTISTEVLTNSVVGFPPLTKGRAKDEKTDAYSFSFNPRTIRPANPVMIGGNVYGGAITVNTILSGFKINTQENEDPLKGQVFNCVLDQQPFATTIGQSEIISSGENLSRAMGIQGDLKLSYGPMAGGEGGGRFLMSTVATKNRVTVDFFSRNTAYVTECKRGSFELEKAIQNKIRDGKEDEIYDIYGTKYIDQLHYGMQISVRYEVTSESEVNQQEVQAELSGKIGMGPLSVEFKAKFDSSQTDAKSLYKLRTEVRVIGSTIPISPNPSFDDINELIERFNADYQNKLDSIRDNGIADNEVVDEMTVIAFSLGDISSNIDGLDQQTASSLSLRMNDLSDTWQDVLFQKATLDVGEKMLDSMFPGGRDRVDIFFKWKDAKDEVMEDIEDTIQACHAFLAQDIATIITSRVPLKVSSRNRYVIDGLMGNSYIPADVTLNGKTFPYMYWEGYALPTQHNGREAFYLGSVFCEQDRSKVIGPARLMDIARTIDQSHCIPAPPSLAPTSTSPTTPAPCTTSGQQCAYTSISVSSDWDECWKCCSKEKRKDCGRKACRYYCR